MLSIREALDLLLPSFAPLAPTRLPLLAAQGCVLASDVTARHDLPPFDNSAMDGYALRFADLTTFGATLPVQTEVRAGGPLPPALLPGHAMRIFTGAPLPANADTVVMQEDTTAQPGTVLVRELPSRVAGHVRKQGSDLRAGQLAVRSGSQLGPGEIGLLAGQGQADVSVFRAPRVAVLCTGDELRDLGDPERPGSIINSNRYALSAALTLYGAVPHVLPIARDDLADVTAKIREGLQADVLLTVGGVSVGDYDLVGRALELAGVKVGFHKVAIKPGKPLMFGTAGNVPVLGLPGNPVSALVSFEVFVRPALRRMQGHANWFPETLTVQLAEPYKHRPGRTELARATLQHDGERYLAHLHPLQGSGSLPSMANVDALVILPADVAHFVPGASLKALRLGPGSYSTRSPWAD